MWFERHRARKELRISWIDAQVYFTAGTAELCLQVITSVDERCPRPLQHEPGSTLWFA